MQWILCFIRGLSVLLTMLLIRIPLKFSCDIKGVPHNIYTLECQRFKYYAGEDESVVLHQFVCDHRLQVSRTDVRWWHRLRYPQTSRIRVQCIIIRASFTLSDSLRCLYNMFFRWEQTTETACSHSPWRIGLAGGDGLCYYCVGLKAMDRLGSVGVCFRLYSVTNV